MSLRRRTYPEVVDNLLTSLTGGVAAEAHPFPPAGGGPPFAHRLEQPPVADVVGIFGSRGGAPHRFRKDVDFELQADAQTLVWAEGAELPDPGTLVQVSYYPQAAQPVVDDIHTGSVLRTVSESVARELARLYAQLEAIYRAGFVDTAEGSSLDNLVALLGVERVRGGRAAGEVEFTRGASSRGTVFIPTGTRVITEDGAVEYQTTADVSLLDGQKTVRVAARDLEPNEPLPAGALSVLPIPIAGVVAVSNPGPTALTTRDEDDAALRARAKSFLHGSERATLGSLRHAVARQGLSAEISELTTDGNRNGRVLVTPQTDDLPPELEQRLLSAIEAVRPVGVEVRATAAEVPQAIDLALRLTSGDGLLEQDLRAAQRAVRDAVAAYFDGLPIGADGSLNRLIGAVLAVPGVEDVAITRALRVDAAGSATDILDRAGGVLAVAGIATRLGELTLADPALPTRLDAVITFAGDVPPADAAQVQSALSSALAYWNGVNAEPPADPETVAPARVVAFGKLLLATPLPGRPAGDLAGHDAAVAAGAAAPLPTAAEVADYALRFVLSAESGLSRVLAADGERYDLTPFERLTLGGVELVVEG